MINFKTASLNSPFDDAAFFVRNVYRRNSFLLDCGRLGSLEHSEILTLREIFISHTHMDHFYGFDRIIRGSLIASHGITVYGPEGFIDNVDGKFRSYTWNLVDEYIFHIKAVELHPDGTIRCAVFAPESQYKPSYVDFDKALKKLSPYFDRVNEFPVIDIGEGFSLEYEFFDHRIPSVGYRITEPIHFSVNKDKLNDFGQKAGPWISEMKRALAEDEQQKKIDVNGLIYYAGDLKERLIDIIPSQTITYITDLAPTANNIEKAVNFARNSTLLIIEAVFTDEDKEHAENKQHLTVGNAKDIFKRSGAQYARFTHFASRYEMDKPAFLSRLYDGMNGRIYAKNERL